jgi:hypothetical protein
MQLALDVGMVKLMVEQDGEPCSCSVEDLDDILRLLDQIDDVLLSLSPRHTAMRAVLMAGPFPEDAPGAVSAGPSAAPGPATRGNLAPPSEPPGARHTESHVESSRVRVPSPFRRAAAAHVPVHVPRRVPEEVRMEDDGRERYEEVDEDLVTGVGVLYEKLMFEIPGLPELVPPSRCDPPVEILRGMRRVVGLLKGLGYRDPDVEIRDVVGYHRKVSKRAAQRLAENLSSRRDHVSAVRVGDDGRERYQEVDEDLVTVVGVLYEKFMFEISGLPELVPPSRYDPAVEILRGTEHVVALLKGLGYRDSDREIRSMVSFHKEVSECAALRLRENRPFLRGPRSNAGSTSARASSGSRSTPAVPEGEGTAERRPSTEHASAGGGVAPPAAA